MQIIRSLLYQKTVRYELFFGIFCQIKLKIVKSDMKFGYFSTKDTENFL